MPKEEWGTKRVCPTTGKRFYDLNSDPIVSPYTGEVVPLDDGKARSLSSGRAAAQTESEESEDTAVLENTDDNDSDVDLNDDVLEDESEESNVSLDELADVSDEDDES